MKKKIVALMLCAVIGIGTLSGCGNGNKDNTNVNSSEQVQKQPEYVYVSSYFDWGEKIGANDWINTYGVINGYQLGIFQSYDETTYKQTQELWIKSLKDETLQRIPVSFEDDSTYINYFTVQEDGTPVVCAEKYEWNEATMSGTSTYRILKLDAQGNILSDWDVSDICKELEENDDWVYLEKVAVDKDAIVYLQFNQQVVALKEDGTKDFIVDIGTYIQNIGNMPDGSVCVSYYGTDANQLSVIDKTTKALGKTYTISDYLSGFFQVGDDYKIYYSDGSAVRAMSLETGETEKVLDWLDCDINGNNITGIFCENTEEIYGYYSDWETDEESFVKLVKTNSKDVKEKTILTLATMYMSDTLQKDVVAFNKANDEYRIKVIEYVDYSSMSQADYDNYDQYIAEAANRMKNELTGNNAPDILNVSDNGGVLSIPELVQKGILEELTPYMEQAGYSLDDFLEGVVNTYKVDDKIYALPSCVGIRTAIANRKIAGDKMGWTLTEAMEMLQNLPEGMGFLCNATQESIITTFLISGYDNFIDRENGVCHFDTEEFLSLLEIAKTFPKEYNYDGDTPVDPILLSNGDVFMTTETLSTLDDIQLCEAYLGDNGATFIGIPGVAGNGSLIVAYNTTYAVCSKSDQKQVAAEFIVDTLTKEYDVNGHNYYGFSSYKPAFDAYVEDMVDVKYIKDEDGNLILDEEGNPIPEQGGHGIGWGDWSYDYRPCTQEDADKLLALVNGACAKANNDTELFGIIIEELQPYLNDQKSAQEVASIIQNRIGLYLAENN